MAVAGVLFFASAALVDRCCRPQFINAGSEKIAQVVTVSPPAGASSEQVLAKADRRPRQILLADAGVELVADEHARARATPARRSSSPRSRAGRANSATMTVRLRIDGRISGRRSRASRRRSTPSDDGRLRSRVGIQRGLHARTRSG